MAGQHRAHRGVPTDALRTEYAHGHRQLSTLVGDDELIRAWLNHPSDEPDTDSPVSVPPPVPAPAPAPDPEREPSPEWTSASAERCVDCRFPHRFCSCAVRPASARWFLSTMAMLHHWRHDTRGCACRRPSCEVLTHLASRFSGE